MHTRKRVHTHTLPRIRFRMRVFGRTPSGQHTMLPRFITARSGLPTSSYGCFQGRGSPNCALSVSYGSFRHLTTYVARLVGSRDSGSGRGGSRVRIRPSRRGEPLPTPLGPVGPRDAGRPCTTEPRVGSGCRQAFRGGGGGNHSP